MQASNWKLSVLELLLYLEALMVRLCYSNLKLGVYIFCVRKAIFYPVYNHQNVQMACLPSHHLSVCKKSCQTVGKASQVLRFPEFLSTETPEDRILSSQYSYMYDRKEIYRRIRLSYQSSMPVAKECGKFYTRSF